MGRASRKLGLGDVAAKGDRRATLEALRDKLAELIDAGEGNEAHLAKQLRDVLADLDSLAVPERSVTDDLAKRRAKRRASVSKRASRRDVGGSGGG